MPFRGDRGKELVPYNIRGLLLERTSRIKGRDLTYAIMHDEREAEMCARSRHAKLAFGKMLHATHHGGTSDSRSHWSPEATPATA